MILTDLELNATDNSFLGRIAMNKQLRIREVVSVCILFFIAFFLGGSATAQVTSSALDTKNGFRDAKLGMLLSSFKGAVPTGTASVSSYGSKTAEYKRPSDILQIGDIKLKSITYTFYDNRLYYITIKADGEEYVSLQKPFRQVYGKPRQFVKADNPELYNYMASVSKYDGAPFVKPKGYVWDGIKVELTMLFTSFLGKSECTIGMTSKVINKEISQHNAKEELKRSKKRAADL